MERSLALNAPPLSEMMWRHEKYWAEIDMMTGTKISGDKEDSHLLTSIFLLF